MAFQFVILALSLAVANAGIYQGLGYSAQAVHQVPAAHYGGHHILLAQAAAPVVAHAAPHVSYYDPHPEYSYQYSVQDAHTGDFKTQEEHREGDVVKGSYSLVEPDGSTRTVHYTADPHHGFNAVVQRTPNLHPAHGHIRHY